MRRSALNASSTSSGHRTRTCAGSLIGSSIVETICLPESCVAIEATAAVVVGIASLIGVGLVAALVTRSFDEYNEHQAAGTEPPGVGCEVPDTDNGTRTPEPGSEPTAGDDDRATDGDGAS